MKEHECKESKLCSCSMTALEPDEECPVHGAGEWPPRCCVCGRYIKRKEINETKESTAVRHLAAD